MKKILRITDAKMLFLSKEKTHCEKSESHFLICLSGGQDSILTFFLLLHKYTETTLDIIYCQHFWQPKNIFSAELIFKLSFLFQIPYTLTLPNKLLLSENISRNWRKSNITRFGSLLKTQNVINGETKTDKIEKNLAKIFRGTTPKNLSQTSLLHSESKVNSFFCLFFQKLVNSQKNNPNKSHYLSSLKFKTNSSVQNYSIFLRQKFDFFSKSQIQKNRYRYQKDIFGSSYSTAKNKFLAMQLGFITRFNIERKISFFKPLPNQNTCFGKTFSPVEEGQNKFRKKLATRYQKQVFDSEKIFQMYSVSCCFANQIKNLKLKKFKPIEKLTRTNISKTVNLYKLPFLQDSTNFSNNFLRNKIRLQLVPYIRSHFSKKFEVQLTNFINLLNFDKDQLENQVTRNIVLIQILNLINFQQKLSKKKKTTFHKQKHVFDYRSTLGKKRKLKKILSNSLLIQNLFFSFKNLDLKLSQNEYLKNLLIYKLASKTVWVTRDSNPELIG